MHANPSDLPWPQLALQRAEVRVSLEYPSDVDWRSMKPKQMFEVLSLPNAISDIRGALDEIKELLGFGGGNDYVNYRQTAAANLGLRSLKIIRDISRSYGVPEVVRSE